MNRINLQAEGVTLFFTKKDLIAFAEDVLRKINAQNWTMAIVLCNNDFIKELNKKFRDKDEATDVLSFPNGETRRGNYDAGDIVISLEELENNAAYFSVDKHEELKRLIIHGILHLNGMDHETNDVDKEDMLKLQEELVAGCRLPDGGF
jgi:probable rRNA maturation factor